MMNLDKRIEGIERMAVSGEFINSDVKQLIRDVIAEVTPKHGDITHKQDQHVNDWSYYDDGWNAVIDDLETKAKELGL